MGGGFYGSAIAIYLARQRGLKRVTLIERETELLARASYNNQARVHNGYHYPRSFTTANRSRINAPRFVRDWPEAIHDNFTGLYAVARRNSKVTARQFERFCREIGADLQTAEPEQKALFNSRLIEQVYAVQECAFDATKLADWATRELGQQGVRVCVGAEVTSVAHGPSDTLRVGFEMGTGGRAELTSRYLFNCTYSGLNRLGGGFPSIGSELKHEIAEMALMKVPPPLDGLGITVMDGPFFSMMPFPARGLHTLSHVRYTPHVSWQDGPAIDPYMKLESYDKVSRADRMVRDVARYLPALNEAKYVESLFEVKTVLAKNEADDGRPILFERHADLPGAYSILGGKIDNIYDIVEKLNAESIS